MYKKIYWTPSTLYSKAGLVNRYIQPKENYEYDEEDYLKEQWDGQMIELKIDIFRLQYPIIGAFCSVALVVNLFELLLSSYNHCKLTFLGFISSILVTCVNLLIFSTFIITNDLEIDWKTAANNKWVASAILGFGATTYLFYLSFAIIKSLKSTGKHWLNIIITYNIDYTL